MNILIIEDQEKLALNIKKYLEMENYAASVVFDGEEGLKKALAENYDLIILDINLPKCDGLQICSLLRRQNKNMPIFMLTARSGQQDIITGLNSGADDYLIKPFDLEVLLARVRALLRRTHEKKDPILSAQNITMDTNTHEVRQNGTVVSLAPKEYALLEYLLRHKGTVQDRSRLIEHVWGEYDSLMFSQTVDVHIAYLRKKLGKKLIKTITGKGYIINN